MNKIKKAGSYLVHKQLPWCILLVLFVIFSCASGFFLNGKNLSNILLQNSYIAVVSMGIMFLLITGAMDLALGYEIALVGVAGAMLMTEAGLPGWLAMIATIVLAIILQLLNTFLSDIIKVAPLLITLGTMTVYQGIAYTISGADVFKGFAKSYLFMGKGSVLGINVTLIITVIVLVIAAVILNKTYLGKHILAVGGNEQAARISGINVKKTRYIVAIMTGVCVGVGSILMFARLGSAHASYGPGTEFTAITACCLGGVSINGGKGTVMGVLAGVLVLGLIANGMQLAGLGAYAQYIIKGTILLASFALDMFQKKYQEKAKMANS